MIIMQAMMWILMALVIVSFATVYWWSGIWIGKYTIIIVLISVLMSLIDVVLLLPQELLWLCLSTSCPNTCMLEGQWEE